MDKTAYLAELKSRSEYVGVPEEEPQKDAVAKDGALKCYRVFVITKDKDGVCQGHNQLFYVLNEGTAEESAFDSARTCANATFGAQVEAYAATQITANRPKVTVDSVNEKYQFALATAYELDAENKIGTVRYFLAKDSAGNPYIRIFKG